MTKQTNLNLQWLRISSTLLAFLSAALFSACQTNEPTTRYRAADSGDFVVQLPRRYKAVSIEGVVFYQSRGNYFQKRGAGYVKVTPPSSTLRSKRAISYRSLYNESAERRKLVRVR